MARWKGQCTSSRRRILLDRPPWTLAIHSDLVTVTPFVACARIDPAWESSDEQGSGCSRARAEVLFGTAQLCGMIGDTRAVLTTSQPRQLLSVR